MLHPKKGQNAENPMFLLLSLLQFFLMTCGWAPSVVLMLSLLEAEWVEKHPRHMDPSWLLSTQDRVPDPDRKKQYKKYWKREDPKCLMGNNISENEGLFAHGGLMDRPEAY